MDTLDFIFLYMGIVGFILSIVSEIIIKIDDIMTDKKIDRYFNSIGVSGSKKWIILFIIDCKRIIIFWKQAWTKLNSFFISVK